MKAFYFFAGLILVLTVAAYIKFRAEDAALAQIPPPAPPTAEEKAYVHEAHRLGTRLYATGSRVVQTTTNKDEQQVVLRPVYEQIEDFIFRRLSNYTNRISSIVVIYRHPAIECTIYVKEGPEDELVMIKRTADRCVGRIIENLPMVKYLMVRDENPKIPENPPPNTNAPLGKPSSATKLFHKAPHALGRNLNLLQRRCETAT